MKYYKSKMAGTYIYMYTHYPDICRFRNSADINEQLMRDNNVKSWMQMKNVGQFPMKKSKWQTKKIRSKFEKFTIENGFFFCENSPNGYTYYVYNGQWSEYSDRNTALSTIHNIPDMNRILIHDLKIDK